jgi:fumarate reductase subunit D
MNFLKDLFWSIFYASGISVAITTFVTLILAGLVNILSLNQDRNAYWALYVTFWVGTISWIISFGYFMRNGT